MIQTYPRGLPVLRASRVVRDPASLRRGNILLEFISAYGLQVALIAGALVLLAGAYALIARTTTGTELRQIVTAAQGMFGKTTGSYKGITTAIVAASAKSGVLPKGLVEGTGATATININGGEFPVYIKENVSTASVVGVNSTKYFVMQVGDATRGIKTVDMCSELARLHLPRLHTTQIITAAAFVTAAATQTMKAPVAATAAGLSALTLGKAPTGTVYEYGEEENNSRVNRSCNTVASATTGAMIVYLIN